MRVRRPWPPGPRTARQRCRRAGRSARVVPVDERRGRARSAAEHVELAEAARPGRRSTSSQHAHEPVGEPLRGGPVEQVGVVLQPAAKCPSGVSRRRSNVEVELGDAGCTDRQLGARSGRAAPAPAPASFCKASMTWNSGCRASDRAGCQRLDQPLERHVLVGEGAQVASRAPGASSSANVGSPDRSVRSTRVLTKNPTRSSSASSVRPATGVPIGMSVPRAEPGQQRGQAPPARP